MAEEIATHVRQSPSGPIEKLPGGSGGAVDSVFGRAGAVVAEPGDYDAGQVFNDSGVGGANVAEALDALDFDIVALQQALATLGLSAVLDSGNETGPNSIRVLAGQSVRFDPGDSAWNDAAIGVLDQISVLHIAASNGVDGSYVQGGNIRIVGGNGSNDGQGGYVSISGGNGGAFTPTLSHGGHLILRGGESYGNGGIAGSIEITGGIPGSLSPSDGGNVTISAEFGRVVISNLAEPVNPQDAATKGYVDANGGGAGGTLEQVLAAGNTTGPHDLAVSSGQSLIFINPTNPGDYESAALNLYASGQLTIHAPNALQGTNLYGPDLAIYAGAADADSMQNGGNMYIGAAQGGSAGGTGGNLIAYAGTSYNQPGGMFAIYAGTGYGTGNGGDGYLSAGGAEETGDGGNLYISGGAANGGTRGRVFISDVADPVNDSDAASKAYVDLTGIVPESTTARTLALEDGGKIIRCTSGAATSVTVPANATVAFAVGVTVIVRQAGAGQVTLVAAGGVVLNTSSTLKSAKQHATVALTKVGPDEWDVTGERAAS